MCSVHRYWRRSGEPALNNRMMSVLGCKKYERCVIYRGNSQRWVPEETSENDPTLRLYDEDVKRRASNKLRVFFNRTAFYFSCSCSVVYFVLLRLTPPAFTIEPMWLRARCLAHGARSNEYCNNYATSTRLEIFGCCHMSLF